MTMIPRHLLDEIDVRWHEALLRFVDSGEAPNEFIQFLEGSEACKRIVDVALNLLNSDLATCAKSLARDPDSPWSAIDPLADPVVNSVLDLPQEQREQTFRKLARALEPEEHKRLENAFAEARVLLTGSLSHGDRNAD